MYQALYRKWRPMTFDDVISQPHITTTLLNQIKTNKTAHAYLFTGSRGTGKTTCARILAKAVNCPNSHDGSPCLKCDICKDADSSSLSDIIEIDAASNNGVDDIRDLRDGAVYTPERCKYKVYIIDEVHMLSTSAFNALLKIMEEPPPYVKFILATTEVHKVPATILSRCQRFDFRRIKAEDIAARLLFIAPKENITLDEEAAQLIARIADGGMRDALSLLDQCIAYSSNITVDTVSSAAGIAGRDYLFNLIECIVSKNPSEALSIIDSLYSMSKDMARLCEELISQFRNIMLTKTVPDKKDLLICLPHEIDRLKSSADKLNLDNILYIIEQLQTCNEKMGRSANKRIEFEMCLIKLCTSQSNSITKPAKTVDNSENYAKIEQSDKLPLPKEKKPVAPAEDTVKVQEQPVDFSKLKSDDFKLCGLWAEVLEEFEKVSPGVSGTLKGSQAFIAGNFMLINAKNEFFVKLFKNKDNALQLSEIVKQVLGKNYTIRARYAGPQKDSDNSLLNIIKKAEDGGVTIEKQN